MLMKQARLIGAGIFILLLILISVVGSLLPESSEELRNTAERRYNQKKFGEALELVNEAIDKDSAAAACYELRGKIYLAI